MNGGKVVNTVDFQIGLRLRARRQELGMSQSALALRISRTVQQIEQYESGETRIGAALLFAIAEALDSPLQYFLSLKPREGDKRSAPARAELGDDEAEALLLGFCQITDTKVRAKIVALVKAMAGHDGDDRPPDDPAQDRSMN